MTWVISGEIIIPEKNVKNLLVHIFLIVLIPSYLTFPE
jgi:hypothetical protein